MNLEEIKELLKQTIALVETLPEGPQKRALQYLNVELTHNAFEAAKLTNDGTIETLHKGRQLQNHLNYLINFYMLVGRSDI